MFIAALPITVGPRIGGMISIILNFDHGDTSKRTIRPQLGARLSIT